MTCALPASIGLDTAKGIIYLSFKTNILYLRLFQHNCDIMNNKLTALFKNHQVKANDLLRVETKLVREGVFSAELMQEFIQASNQVIKASNEILDELALQGKLLEAEAMTMKFWLN